MAECENRGWTAYFFPLEVGSSGLYNTSFSKFLVSLEIPIGKRKPKTKQNKNKNKTKKINDANVLSQVQRPHSITKQSK